MKSKKMFILLLLTLFSLFFIKNNDVKAYDPADYLIDEEISDTFFQFYLNINYDQSPLLVNLDKMFYKQNVYINYIYKGYLDLNISQNNLFEIEVNKAIENLEYYDVTNIKDLYFIIEFENINTVSGQFKSDNLNISYIDNKTLKYSLDYNNLPSNLFFNVWFASLENPSTPVNTGNIRITNLRLFLEFNDPVSTIKDVKSDYSLLPNDIDKKFILIDKFELLHEASQSYKFFFQQGITTYAFDISIPSDININNFIKLDGKLNASYSTYQGQKFLYLQPDKTKNPYPEINGTVDDPAELMIGFITINITDSTNVTYDTVKRLEMDTIVAKESNSNAFMYAFFPLAIEDIINIRVTYTYRYKYFGFAGKWQTVDNIYAWDDTATINAPWWMDFGPLSVAAAIGNIFNVLDIKTIQRVARADLSDYVVDRYVNKLGGNLNDLNTLTTYKIHLGQFSVIGSTNYDISEHEVLEITYMYQGQVYSVPYDLIDQDNENPDVTQTIGELNFSAFLKFEGVKDLASFLLHIVKYWQEALLFLLLIIIKIIFIFIIIKFIRFFKLRRNYFRPRNSYYRSRW